jgi:hypothetical protein
VLVVTLVTSPVAIAGHGNGVAAGALAKSSLPTAIVRRPDGRVRFQGGTWVGNDIYNSTGTHQARIEKTYSPIVGQHYAFGISIQNDGNRADSFKVKASGTATGGWKMRYFRGTTNITPAVVAGTYRTSSLAPSTTFLITAKVSFVGPSEGDITRLVMAKSVANSAKEDVVKIGVKLVSCGC